MLRTVFLFCLLTAGTSFGVDCETLLQDTPFAETKIEPSRPVTQDELSLVADLDETDPELTVIYSGDQIEFRTASKKGNRPPQKSTFLPLEQTKHVFHASEIARDDLSNPPTFQIPRVLADGTSVIDVFQYDAPTQQIRRQLRLPIPGELVAAEPLDRHESEDQFTNKVATLSRLQNGTYRFCVWGFRFEDNLTSTKHEILAEKDFTGSADVSLAWIHPETDSLSHLAVISAEKETTTIHSIDLIKLKWNFTLQIPKT